MSVNNDNFMIEREDIEIAQNVSGVIEDKSKRNRAAADVLAALASEKYFQDTDVDILSGIHNSGIVLNRLDISDIYIKDNYLDVRIYFDESEMCVPKCHFDLDILPVAYMFIKVSEDFSEGHVTGFVFPEDITTDADSDGYYAVTENDLKSFYDVEARLNTVEDEDYDSVFEKTVYDYLDGLPVDEELFYKTLISSKASREYLLSTDKAFRMYCSLNTPPKEVSEAPETSDENNMPQAVEQLPEDNIITPLDEADDVEPLELSEPDELSLDLTENIVSEEVNLLEEVNPDESNQLMADINESEPIETLEEAEELPLEEASAENPVEIQNEPEESAESQYEELPIVDEEIEETATVENADNTDVLSDYEDIATPAEPTLPTDEFDELSKFDYSTEIEPSMNSILSDEDSNNTITEEMLDVSDQVAQQNNDNDETTNENEEQIETLFDNEPHAVNTSSKKKGSPITIIGLLVLACLLSYVGYTKYFAPMQNPPSQKETKTTATNNIIADKKVRDENVAMPNETVENNVIPEQDNEPAAVNIPAIEQNLNASIEVSNLSVNWEVPLSYANNTTAKRYFVRIGKVLQLNLKTELLLVSSPPITNKISVELEYNKSTNKFVINKIIDSSGVTVVDNVIKDTINRTLNMNLSTNMSVFDSLQGNPVLIIKL